MSDYGPSGRELVGCFISIVLFGLLVGVIATLAVVKGCGAYHIRSPITKTAEVRSP